MYKLLVIKKLLISKYLRGLLYRADNASMLNSVEVRVPFLSKTIVRDYCNEPVSWRVALFSPKFVLKLRAASRLGMRFAFAKKRGFAVPWFNWYTSSSIFSSLWEKVKADPFIAEHFEIPKDIEHDPAFNAYFERAGFRLMCIYIYRNNPELR